MAGSTHGHGPARDLAGRTQHLQSHPPPLYRSGHPPGHSHRPPSTLCQHTRVSTRTPIAISAGATTNHNTLFSSRLGGSTSVINHYARLCPSSSAAGASFSQYGLSVATCRRRNAERKRFLAPPASRKLRGAHHHRTHSSAS